MSPIADRTPPPAILPLIRENLPLEDLSPYPNCVTWDLEPRENESGPAGWTKVLKNPRTGRNARSDAPTTWATANDVLTRFDRFGYVVAENDPFTFIDIDKGVDATGDIKPWAQAIVDRFPNGYWERSTTGTGLKGLIRGRSPERRDEDGRTRNRGRILIGDGKVEVFYWGKFTALTGHRLECSSPIIGDGQAALEAFIAEHCPAPAPQPVASAPEISADDQTIIERARKMTKGRRLFDDGDTSDYTSGSEADLGLLNCFRSCGASDATQLDRLYRASALFRIPKRQKQWSRESYRNPTISRALDGTVSPWPDWNQPTPAVIVLGKYRSEKVAAAPDQALDNVQGSRPCSDRVAELEQIVAQQAGEIIALRGNLAAAKSDASALAQAILNPELTRNQLITAVAVATEVRAKQARGETQPDGKIVLSQSEIADDWRPAPEKGERVAPVNPRSGRRPRMARERVGSLMAEAVENGLIRAKPVKALRQHSNGSTYKTTDWVVDPVESIAAALNPWISYRQDDPKERKPRTVPQRCPECGEVHQIRRVDYCTGCGAIVNQKIIEPQQVPAATGASDDLSEAKHPSPTVVTPSLNVRSFIGGDIDPDDLSDPWDPPASAAHTQRTLIAQGAPDQWIDRSGLSQRWAGD